MIDSNSATMLSPAAFLAADSQPAGLALANDHAPAPGSATAFRLWALAQGSTQWLSADEASPSPPDDRTCTVLTQSATSPPVGAGESILIERDGGQILLGLSLGEMDGHRLAATAILEDSPEELARQLACQLLDNFSLKRQLSQYREDLDACAAQIGNDYEELALMRTLAEYLEISEAAQGMWHVAEKVLPALAGALHAESLVLVTARQEEKDPSQVHVGRPVMRVGPARLDDEACCRFIEVHRGRAVGQPLVNNHLAPAPEGSEFSGIRKFLMVALAKGSRTFGWLVAINHTRRQDDAVENPLWQSSRFEFGTVEAGLLSAVASMLATHARNVELFREREALLINIVRAMVSAIDAKDPYTCGHSERVGLVARFLGQQLGLGEVDCERLYLAGLLHDLGKLGVPDSILRKPGPLTPEETEQLRMHPERGWAILQDLGQLQHLVPGILCHHESYDGTGYPDGLAGEAIPVIARILAVADSYDAMVSDRPYRQGMPIEKVEAIFRNGSGRQWDPKVIDILLGNLPEIKALWDAHQPQAPRVRRRPETQFKPPSPPAPLPSNGRGETLKCRSGVKGITAIELVIVVLILGILAAAAVPKYAGALTQFRVDAAARRIAADLATAQARARATSSSLSVVFTLPPQGSQYQVAGMPDPDHLAAAYTVNLAGPPYRVALTTADLGGTASLTYNGYGIPSSGGTIVLQAGTCAKTILVDATTGIAAIQ